MPKKSDKKLSSTEVNKKDKVNPKVIVKTSKGKETVISIKKSALRWKKTAKKHTNIIEIKKEDLLESVQPDPSQEQARRNSSDSQRETGTIGS